MFKVNCDERESAAEYFCEERRTYVCNQCEHTNHEHNKMDIQQTSEERKFQTKMLFDRVEAKIVEVEAKIQEQTAVMKNSEDEINYAEKEITETVKEGIRLLGEHEMAMKTKLAGIRENQRRKHSAKIESLETLAAQLRSSLQYGKNCVQRGSGPEILQEQLSVCSRCEDLLNAEEIQIYKPPQVRYVSRRSVLASQVVTSHSDSSQSRTERTDLKDRGVHEFEFELSSG